jgi:glycosyltransferase involved in cell wall biosynthesis
MEEQPIVSIVTPTYNQAPFLRETIESVLSQDYPRIEYLVIDDGSTDETREILRGYSGRLKWESQTNMGQTPTINKGWKKTTGTIITWLNSDDTLLPRAISEAILLFHKHPDVDIIYGDTLYTQADGTPLEYYKPGQEFDYINFVIECHNPIAQPSAFIRRKVFDNIGELDPHYYYFMDWDFWLRAGLAHKFKYFPELFSTYRLHEHSKSVAQLVRAAPELEYMYRKFYSNQELPRWIRNAEKRAYANMYFMTATYYTNGNDPKIVKRMGINALLTYPTMLLRPKMVHKFLYCMLSTFSFYKFSRSAYRSLRQMLNSASQTG